MNSVKTTLVDEILLGRTPGPPCRFEAADAPTRSPKRGPRCTGAARARTAPPPAAAPPDRGAWPTASHK
eukprot:6004103-Prymnesium_polylepis.1